jgi:cell division protein FtsW
MKSNSPQTLLAKPVTHLYLLLISAGALSFLGLIMVFSASSIHAIDTRGSALSIVIRQFVFLLISIPFAMYLSKLALPTWEKVARFGFIISALILAVLIVPGVGKTVHGNTNWIDFKIFDVQPSEFAKFFMILWASNQLARRELNGRFETNVLKLITPAFLIILFLVMMGNDLGTASVIAMILAGLLFVSGIRLKILGTITAFGAIALALLIVTSGYRSKRFLVFLNPFAPEDYKDLGWQPAHSLLGLASGGLFGVGLGGSRQKWGNLPEAHTDFIFSVIGEELGLVGTLATLILIGALVYAIFRIALRAQDPMSRYACAGIATWIAVQSFLNLGSATSVLPVVGVTLPLVSYGGSALAAMICSLGFVAGTALRDPDVRRELVKKRSK